MADRKKVGIKYGAHPRSSPCKGCADRHNGCHSSAECERWAEYENQKAGIKEQMEKGQDVHYFKVGCYNRGQCRRNYNYHKKSWNKS